jgi:2-dehydropantoate 2-reductase
MIMKILIWGRGAVGTQYAWAFENAGHDVEFYVREGRKIQYGTYVNMEILDARRGKKNRQVREKWSVKTYDHIEENHDYDLIFVSVNPEQVEGAVKCLSPKAGNATVLFIGNYWGDIRESIHPLPLDQVIWGFPGCGGGFEGNTFYGGLYRTVHLGISGTKPTERDLGLHKLFAGAGFKVMIHKDFQSWLRNHFAANVAMEAEAIKSGGFGKAVSLYEACIGIAHNTREIIPVLKAKGAKIYASTGMLGYLPPSVVGFLMNRIVFSPKGMPYALMQHNHYEAGAAVREIISEAKKHGIKTPRLQAAAELIAERKEEL